MVPPHNPSRRRAMLATQSMPERVSSIFLDGEWEELYSFITDANIYLNKDMVSALGDGRLYRVDLETFIAKINKNTGFVLKSERIAEFIRKESGGVKHTTKGGTHHTYYRIHNPPSRNEVIRFIDLCPTEKIT